MNSGNGGRLWGWLMLTAILVASTQVRAGVILGEPILGGNMIVASEGKVNALFLGSSAGYFNSLYLESPGDGLFLFDKRTPWGTMVELGTFDAGEELVFRLDVRNTGLSFFSGPGDANPDGIPHVLATTYLVADLYTTTVGFEDLLGGGDRDYNDFMFMLTNVIDPPAPAQVPLPASALLMATGFGLLGVRRRSRVRPTA